jgi:hypothetical protein
MRDLTTIAIKEKLKFVEINFSARFIETNLKFAFLRENIFRNPILSSFLLKSIFKICFLIIRVPFNEIDIEYLAIGNNGVSQNVFDIKNSERIN